MTTQIVYVCKNTPNNHYVRHKASRQAGRLTREFHVPFHMLAKTLSPRFLSFHGIEYGSSTHLFKGISQYKTKIINLFPLSHSIKTLANNFSREFTSTVYAIIDYKKILKDFELKRLFLIKLIKKIEFDTLKADLMLHKTDLSRQQF